MYHCEQKLLTASHVFLFLKLEWEKNHNSNPDPLGSAFCEEKKIAWFFRLTVSQPVDSQFSISMLEERILFFDVELYGSIFFGEKKKNPTPDYVARIFKDRSWEKTRKK